jgi:hypothetical protein
MTEILHIWSYLSEGPLLWLTLTVVAYVIGDNCFALPVGSPM